MILKTNFVPATNNASVRKRGTISGNCRGLILEIILNSREHRNPPIKNLNQKFVMCTTLVPASRWNMRVSSDVFPFNLHIWYISTGAWMSGKNDDGGWFQENCVSMTMSYSTYVIIYYNYSHFMRNTFEIYSHNLPSLWHSWHPPQKELVSCQTRHEEA